MVSRVAWLLVTRQNRERSIGKHKGCDSLIFRDRKRIK